MKTAKKKEREKYRQVLTFFIFLADDASRQQAEKDGDG